MERLYGLIDNRLYFIRQNQIKIKRTHQGEDGSYLGIEIQIIVGKSLQFIYHIQNDKEKMRILFVGLRRTMGGYFDNMDFNKLKSYKETILKYYDEIKECIEMYLKQEPMFRLRYILQGDSLIREDEVLKRLKGDVFGNVI